MDLFRSGRSLRSGRSGSRRVRKGKAFMKLKIAFIAAAILGAVTLTPAYSRIGWTLDQCVAEYGPDIACSKVQRGGVAYWFENKHKLQVTVVIRNDKVQYIAYARPDGTDFYQEGWEELSAEKLPDGATWEDPRPGTFAVKNGVRILFRTHSKKEIIFVTQEQLDLEYQAAKAAGK